MFGKHKSMEKKNMSEIDDLILKNFEIKRRLGKGAYGIVWKAVDKTTSETVAVKKIFDAFRNETDAQRTFREIMFLRAFRNHPNIIQLHSVHRAANHMDIYLSFEYMESDLHNVIKRGTVLRDLHKRYIMYQLLNAIKYIHSGNVIHRDLKPSNVLIDSRCKCKIADFGLARSVAQRQLGEDGIIRNNEMDPALTDYVATRWYRAPEILIASKHYTKGIDMWGLGCILGEMIKGKPLFPGTCTVNQVERIVSALPEATSKDINAVGSGFGSVLLNQSSSKSCNDQTLDILLVGGPEDGIALAKELLVLDPAKRLTAKEALYHKYVEKFQNTTEEPELNSDIVTPFRDDVQLSVHEYRSKLYEIMSSSVKSINHQHSKTNSNKLKQTQSNHKLDSGIGMSTPGHKLNNNISKKLDRKGFENVVHPLPHSLPQPPPPSLPLSLTPTFSQQLPAKQTIEQQAQSRNLKGIQSLRTNHLMMSKSSNEDVSGGNINGDTKIKLLGGLKHTRVAPISTSGHNAKYYFKSSYSHNPFDKKTTAEINNLANHSFDSRKNSNNYDIRVPIVDNNFRNDTSASKISSLSVENKRNGVAKKKINNFDNSSTNLPRRMNNLKQKSLDENMISPIKKSVTDNSLPQDYYESRLKSLEEKIRRHKLDMNTFLHQQNAKSGVRKLENSMSTIDPMRRKPNLSLSDPLIRSKSSKLDLHRSKSFTNREQLNSMPSKFDFPYAEGDTYKINRSNTNYGVISASDLFKLRSSEIIS